MSDRPNVYLLSADSLGADHATDLSARVAERTEGTRFTNAVAPASHTASSVPGLSTGQFVDGSGPGDGTPLPSWFAADGYQTHVLTDNPLVAASLDGDTDAGDAGGLRNRLDDLLPRRLTRTVERAYFRRIWPLARRLGLAAPYYRPAATLHERANDVLSDSETPAFCWIHYMDTHSPYHVSRDGDAIDGADRHRTAARSRSVAVGGASAADPADVASVSRLYRAACEDLGGAITDFVDRLRERGLYDPDRDVLAVTSDHGECLDPDRGVLGHLPPASWESLIHVPLVVARPDWPETTVTRQVSLVDLPGMLRPAVGDAPAPVEFAREYAVTVAGTLGDVGTLRGIRRADGHKLFGRRTEAGTDAVYTRYDAGTPATETVVERWDDDIPTADVPEELVERAVDRGGVVDGASYVSGLDESHLRALGYVE